jgi:hypothetical protein
MTEFSDAVAELASLVFKKPFSLADPEIILAANNIVTIHNKKTEDALIIITDLVNIIIDKQKEIDELTEKLEKEK